MSTRLTVRGRPWTGVGATGALVHRPCHHHLSCIACPVPAPAQETPQGRQARPPSPFPSPTAPPGDPEFRPPLAWAATQCQPLHSLPLREQVELVAWALRKAPVPILPQVCPGPRSLCSGLHLSLSLATFPGGPPAPPRPPRRHAGVFVVPRVLCQNLPGGPASGARSPVVTEPGGRLSTQTQLCLALCPFSLCTCPLVTNPPAMPRSCPKAGLLPSWKQRPVEIAGAPRSLKHPEWGRGIIGREAGRRRLWAEAERGGQRNRRLDPEEWRQNQGRGVSVGPEPQRCVPDPALSPHLWHRGAGPFSGLDREAGAGKSTWGKEASSCTPG